MEWDASLHIQSRKTQALRAAAAYLVGQALSVGMQTAIVEGAVLKYWMMSDMEYV